MSDVDMELLLLDDSEQYWELHLDEYLMSRGKVAGSAHKVTAYGYGYDLAEKIANNYKEKYNPESYIITSKSKNWSQLSEQDLHDVLAAKSFEELEALDTPPDLA